jgi:AAA domain
MALFKPAESTSAYLKMGLLGFAGSGKTKTASLTAIGLVLHARQLKIPYADKPVFFIDTETGSDWVKPDFDKAGVPLMVAKTRAFTDLLQAVEDAQKDGSLLLIDSISHFWKELTDSYCKKKAAQFKTPTYRLQFQDWGYLKGEWGKFTDAFINSPLHIILCGRAGYEYDYFENDEGKKELEKTGVKMKAEGEMGYEPSLLVLMERNQKIERGTVESSWREATVIKDRSTLLDGKVFTFDADKKSLPELVKQTFGAFRPHIELLNLGGKQLGVDTSRTSEHAVQVEKKDWHSVQKAIVLEEIEAVLVEHYPSAKAEDKQAKNALVLKHFGTRSWTEVCNMRVDELRERYDNLYRELKNEPSRYSAIVAAENASTDLNDSLPDHSAPPAAPSLEGQLLADIANNKTLADCVAWAIEVNNKHREALGVEGFNRVNAALMNHQSAILKAEQNKKPKDDSKEPDGEPPATPGNKGRKTAAKAVADAPERTMADLVSAG